MIYINPYLSVLINTIIGGVAGSISTKALLATKLAISESIITRFQIVGSDVHAHITSSYVLPSSSFRYSTEITKFIDMHGLTMIPSDGTVHFSESSITEISMPRTLYMPTCQYCTSLTKVYTPLVNSIGGNALQGCTSLNDITTGVITHLGSSAMINIPTISPPVISTEITSIGNNALEGTKYLELIFNQLTSQDASAWRFLTLSKKFIAPKLVTISNANTCFANWTSAELISMKKLKTYGTTPAGVTANSTGFGNLKTGCKIEVNSAMLTANAGAVHNAFLYAKNTRGAIVEFYNDDGSYHSTL